MGFIRLKTAFSANKAFNSFESIFSFREIPKKNYEKIYFIGLFAIDLEE